MSSTFKLAFLTTLLIAVGAIALAVFLGMNPEPTPETVKNIASLWQVATAAIGVITGLVGGKAS